MFEIRLITPMLKDLPNNRTYRVIIKILGLPDTLVVEVNAPPTGWSKTLQSAQHLSNIGLNCTWNRQ